MFATIIQVEGVPYLAADRKGQVDVSNSANNLVEKLQHGYSSISLAQACAHNMAYKPVVVDFADQDQAKSLIEEPTLHRVDSMAGTTYGWRLKGEVKGLIDQGVKVNVA